MVTKKPGGLDAEILRGMRARLEELPPLDRAKELAQLPLDVAAKLLATPLEGAGGAHTDGTESIDTMIERMLADGERRTTAEIKTQILSRRIDVKVASVGAALARLKRSGVLVFREGSRGMRDGTYEITPQRAAARKPAGKR